MNLARHLHQLAAALLRSLHRKVEIAVWLARVSWLHACDRWFVFRDAPDHVVEAFADLFDGTDDADAMALAQQARDELALRSRRETQQQ